MFSSGFYKSGAQCCSLLFAAVRMNWKLDHTVVCSTKANRVYEKV